MAHSWPNAGWQSPVLLLVGFALLVFLEITVHRFYFSHDNPLIAPYPTRHAPHTTSAVDALHWPFAALMGRAQGGSAQQGRTAAEEPLAGRGKNESEFERVARNVAGQDRSLIFVTASKTFIDFLENWCRHHKKTKPLGPAISRKEYRQKKSHRRSSISAKEAQLHREETSGTSRSFFLSSFLLFSTRAEKVAWGMPTCRVGTCAQSLAPVLLEGGCLQHATLLFVLGCASAGWHLSAKFGKQDKVLFIAEDAVAYEHIKRRWPTQTVMVSLEDLHLEKEITGSSSQANVNATFSTPYVSGAQRGQAQSTKHLVH